MEFYLQEVIHHSVLAEPIALEFRLKQCYLNVDHLVEVNAALNRVFVNQLAAHGLSQIFQLTVHFDVFEEVALVTKNL